jgi:hypothetical protein
MWYPKKLAKLGISISVLTLVACHFPPQVKAGENIKKINKVKGKVTVRLVLLQPGKNYKCRAVESWRWGTERRCPKNVIDKLKIKYGRESAFVSFSAFSDLANFRSVSIETNEDTSDFVVIIKGGDAATSYIARLNFRGKLLLERIVRHGEFPKNAWEKTIYKFNY